MGKDSKVGSGLPQQVDADVLASTRRSKHSKKTTLMIRNIPNNMTRELFMALLESQGFARSYDFVYLPMDFKRHAGYGYAFVNCVAHGVAERMMQHFQGFND